MSEDVNNTEVRFGKPAVIQRPLAGTLAPDGGEWTGGSEGYSAADDGTTAASEKPASRASSVLRELVETIVLTLVIFFLVRTVIQNYRIDGISMEPNFHNGQFLIINKLAYRLGEPARGDVIVFHYPRDPSRDFIKRVIGLPGDTVEVRSGQVIVNGEIIDEPYEPSPGTYDSEPVTLPEDQLFVMGDNRNNSSDSHIWGALPMENVIGKAVVSYWPPSDWGLVTNEAAADR